MTTTINASTSAGLVNTADTSGILQFQTAGTAAVTINASQNVGIGTGTIRAHLDVNDGTTNTTGDGLKQVGITGANVASTTSTGLLTIQSNNAFAVDLGGSIAFGGRYATANDAGANWAFIAGLKSTSSSGDLGGYLQFSTRASSGGATTEKMRITDAGDVLIGATAPTQTADGLFVKGRRTATSNQWNFQVYTQAGQATLSCRDDYYLRSVAIYDRTVGSAANVNIDSSGYLYRSTSSLKYKRDVVDYDKGIATVTQLRPVYYKSKVNDPDGNPVNTQYAGLIAEELDALGLDEFVVKDNTGEVESIHYGNMVALLTKAIQEQQALITQLQADVAALKGA
jgi:hypothetical protein